MVWYGRRDRLFIKIDKGSVSGRVGTRASFFLVVFVFSLSKKLDGKLR